MEGFRRPQILRSLGYPGGIPGDSGGIPGVSWRYPRGILGVFWGYPMLVDQPDVDSQRFTIGFMRYGGLGGKVECRQDGKIEIMRGRTGAI